MGTENEKVVKLYNEAEQMVSQLEILYKEVGSYKAATLNIDKAGMKLLDFISETKTLAAETHALIQQTKTIGTQNIIDSIAQEGKRLTFQFNENQTATNALKNKIEAGVKEIAQVIDDESDHQEKLNKRLLVIVLLSSVISLISLILVILK